MRYLTGIQPSGDLHIGNYFGAIEQIVKLQSSGEVFAFIANYHALTTMDDGARLSELTRKAAVDFLSLGIDPHKSVFWVQSEVKEVLELYWILSQFTPMGLLERGHSYKDKLAKGKSASHGLFSYPVLMAADILIYGSDAIPVGKDQIQHVEIARDIAVKFNNKYGEIFKIPEFIVSEDQQTVPGIDGEKMSKSYGNTIDIFCDEATLEARCKKIVTDSTPVEEEKNYATCNVYQIAKLFLDKQGELALQQRYLNKKEGYGHFKMYLKELIWDYFEPFRKKRKYYQKNAHIVDEVLYQGAKRAREVAKITLDKVRQVVGV